RWDPYFGTVIPNGWVSHFDMNAFLNNVHSTVYPNGPAGTLYPGDSGYGAGDRPMKPKLNNWAPRLGLAWDPQGNGRMTVRASWGMFYDFPSTLYYYGYSNEPPWGQAITYNSPPGGFSNPWQGFPGGNPFPYTFSKNSVFPIQAPYVNVPMDYHPPYLNQWNLSVEKQIGANWLAKVSYLGSNTIHFWSPQALNPSVYIPGTCAAGQYGLAVRSRQLCGNRLAADLQYVGCHSRPGACRSKPDGARRGRQLADCGDRQCAFRNSVQRDVRYRYRPEWRRWRSRDSDQWQSV